MSNVEGLFVFANKKGYTKMKKKISSIVGLLLSLLLVFQTVGLPISAMDSSESHSAGLENPILSSGEVSDETDTTPAEEPPEPLSSSGDELESYLSEHGLRIDEKGKLRYTEKVTADLHPDVYQEIIRLLGKNKGIMLFSNGFAVDLDMSQTLYADVWFSDNHGAYLWHPKRVNGELAFCSQHGVPLFAGENGGYSPSPAARELEHAFALIAYFGYILQPSLENEYYSQIMIWEEQGVHPVSISGAITMSGYNAFKAAVYEKIHAFHTKPSFDDETILLKQGESVTLTDTNAVFAAYEETENTSGVTFEKNGNAVTFRASSSATSGSISFQYAVADGYTGTSIYYEHPETQNVVVTKVHAQTTATIQVLVEKDGFGKIVKKSTDTGAVLAGARYKVTNNMDTSVEYLTTGADGAATTKAYPSGTVLTITEVTAPNQYVLDTTPQTITIEANKTKSVTFSNQLAQGIIRLDKSALQSGKTMPTSSYSLTGNVFHVFDSSGTRVATLTTNVSGKAESQKLNIGKYTVREVTASAGFLLNPKTFDVEIRYDGQTVALTYADIAAINTEQQGSALLYKRDKDTDAIPQGKASFDGAVFRLERKESDGKWNTVGEYTTDKTGRILVENLYLATYRWTELKAPEGYTLDVTPIVFDILYAGQTAQTAVTAESKKYNAVISGSVEGLKVGKPLVGDPESDELFPLHGVQFTATSQTTGKKYTAATDKHGRFAICDLPFDDYILTESKGIEGYSLIKPIAFSIREEKQVIEYILKNELSEQRVKIIKVDVDTGKVLPVAGVGFKIFDTLLDDYLVMQVPNSSEKSDVFVTNDDGYLVTSGTLKYGIDRYVLEEVQAPAGYTLSERKITFSVGYEVTLIQEIVFGNQRARGKATLVKTGDTPVAVITEDTEYGPLQKITYAPEKKIAGVVYEIYAATDIVGVEGTVFYEKDAFVDTLITDEDGTATTKLLELGSYYAVEVSAPSGYVPGATPIPFEIRYEDQTVSLTETEIQALNAWQTVIIKLRKQEERLTGYENNKPKIDILDSVGGKVFGLFAAEDIHLSEDLVISSDTLLALAETKNGTAAFGALQLPEHSYYVRELKTDDAHVLDESKYPVTYTPDNRESVTIEIENGKPLLNRLFLTDITFMKQNEIATLVDGSGYAFSYDIPGTGAVFELLDMDFTVIQTLTIGKDGLGTWTDLTVGTYYQREIAPSSGEYLLQEETLRIVVTKESVTVYDENNHELKKPNTTMDILFSLTNDLVKGSVSIVKKDAVTNEPLVGAGFRLYNASGEIVAEGETGEDGVWTVTNLPLGEYTFVETKAPDGYILDETPIVVQVTTDGETVTCEKVNKRIPDTPSVPKTGEMDSGSLRYILLGFLGLCAGTLFLLRNRKARKEEE